MVQSCQYMECNYSDGIGRHSVALYLCLLNNGKLVLAVCFAPDCCDHQVLLVSSQNCFYDFLLFQHSLVSLHDMQVLVVVVQVLLCCYLCDIALSFDSQTACHPIAGLHFDSNDVVPLDLVVLELIHCNSTGVDHRIVVNPTQVR